MWRKKDSKDLVLLIAAGVAVGYLVSRWRSHRAQRRVLQRVMAQERVIGAFRAEIEHEDLQRRFLSIVEGSAAEDPDQDN